MNTDSSFFVFSQAVNAQSDHHRHHGGDGYDYNADDDGGRSGGSGGRTGGEGHGGGDGELKPGQVLLVVSAVAVTVV